MKPYVCFLVVSFAVLLPGCGESNRPATVVTKVSAPVAPVPVKESDPCKDEASLLWRAKFLAENVPADGVDVLRPCQTTLSQEGQALYKKISADAKKAHDQTLKRDAKARAEEVAAEKRVRAVKKTEGVRIGMSQQDVLESSWGRPQSTNRTQTQYGNREQWVYGIGSYLYFENGVLTAIQN